MKFERNKSINLKRKNKMLASLIIKIQQAHQVHNIRKEEKIATDIKEIS